MHLPTNSPPLEAPLIAMRLAVVYFSWIRYSAAHWKSSKQFCLFASVPPSNAQHNCDNSESDNRKLTFYDFFITLSISLTPGGQIFPPCTFVPGEAVLSAPSDVGHRQDPSQVSHKQQVSNTERDNRHRQEQSVQTRIKWGKKNKKFIHFKNPIIMLCLHLYHSWFTKHTQLFISGQCAPTDSYICIIS